MEDAIVTSVMNLGLGGLLFYMWWQERRNRQDEERDKKALLSICEQFLSVVTNNTKAFVRLEGLIEEWGDRPCIMEGHAHPNPGRRKYDRKETL